MVVLPCRKITNPKSCSTCDVVSDPPSSPQKDIKRVSQCLFLEVFAGTAGTTAAVRKVGLQTSVGVDNAVSTKCKAPVIRLDLTTSHAIQLLWEVMRRPNLIGVHLARPRGTTSRAREIKRKKEPNPVPLRSEARPDGLKHLTGVTKENSCGYGQLFVSSHW